MYYSTAYLISHQTTDLWEQRRSVTNSESLPSTNIKPHNERETLDSEKWVDKARKFNGRSSVLLPFKAKNMEAVRPIARSRGLYTSLHPLLTLLVRIDVCFITIENLFIHLSQVGESVLWSWTKGVRTGMILLSALSRIIQLWGYLHKKHCFPDICITIRTYNFRVEFVCTMKWTNFFT